MDRLDDAGELRRSLKQARLQQGVEAFRESLKRSASGIKGLAVSRGDDAPDGVVAIDVEIVYADRNERQKMLLVQQGNGWVITSIETATVIEPSIPYGTPVFQEEDGVRPDD